MPSVLEQVEKTLDKAAAVQVEIVKKKARRDQLLERLDKDFGLKSVEEAEARVVELDTELSSLEKKMEKIRAELDEALNA